MTGTIQHLLPFQESLHCTLTTTHIPHLLAIWHTAHQLHHPQCHLLLLRGIRRTDIHNSSRPSHTFRLGCCLHPAQPREYCLVQTREARYRYGHIRASLFLPISANSHMHSLSALLSILSAYCAIAYDPNANFIEFDWVS